MKRKHILLVSLTKIRERLLLTEIIVGKWISFSPSCRNTSPFENHSCIFLVTAIERKRFQLKGHFPFNQKVSKNSTCNEEV